MRLSTSRKIKQVAYWAAFCVLAVAFVVVASLIGAELAGEPIQAGWALAKLVSLITVGLCALGWLCSLIED